MVSDAASAGPDRAGLRMSTRRRLVALGSPSAAIATVLVVANVDHRLKQGRINRAQVEAWYRNHQGTGGGGDDLGPLEDRWSVRERGNNVATALLIGGVAIVAFGWRRSRSRGPQGQL